MSERVVVVGGGLTGLVTAHELQRRGVPATVLEAGSRLGGRIDTVHFADGATAESGMEEFWDTSPAYDLLRALGLPLIEQPAPSSVVLDGRLHAYGDGYFDELAAIGGADAFPAWSAIVASVTDELAVARRTGRRRARLGHLMRVPFSSFVAGTRLPPLMQSWIRVVVESETGVEWDCIAALDGVAEMAPFMVGPAHPAGHVNVRVAGGNGRLVEALAADLPDGTVRLGARVGGVIDQGDGVAVTYADGSGRQHVVRGTHAVITLPLWQLGAIRLEPRLDRPARAALASTAWGSYVKVVLRLRPERVCVWEAAGNDPFPLLTDGPAGCVYFTDGRTCGRDHVVTMLVPAAHARALSGRGHGEIVARSIDALEHLTDGPSGRPLLGGVGAAVVEARVFDHPRAVACWPSALGRSRFDRLADALRAPHGRVLIGGDSTDSSHSDGAVGAGQRMAAHLLGGACYAAAS